MLQIKMKNSPSKIVPFMLIAQVHMKNVLRQRMAMTLSCSSRKLVPFMLIAEGNLLRQRMAMTLSCSSRKLVHRRHIFESPCLVTWLWLLVIFFEREVSASRIYPLELGSPCAAPLACRVACRLSLALSHWHADLFLCGVHMSVTQVSQHKSAKPNP
jgi:hypothetical protein